ncbi:MAG: hypothetical protein ACQ9MH_12345 [Nitrospinales bacterium]
MRIFIDYKSLKMESDTEKKIIFSGLDYKMLGFSTLPTKIRGSLQKFFDDRCELKIQMVGMGYIYQVFYLFLIIGFTFVAVMEKDSKIFIAVPILIGLFYFNKWVTLLMYYGKLKKFSNRLFAEEK